MLRQSTLLRVWLGGAAANPSLGLDLRPVSGQFVNTIPEGSQRRRTAGHFHPTPAPGSTYLAQPEARQTAARLPEAKPAITKWSRHLRADIYDELLKLPLRFSLHDFDKLQRHLHASSSSSLPNGIYHFPPEGGAEHEQAGVSRAAAAGDFYAVAGHHSAVGYAPPLGPADPLDTLPFFVHRSSNGHLPGKVYSMHAKNLMPAFYMRIQGIDGDVFRFEEELIKLFPTKKIFVRSHSIYVYNVSLDGRAVLHHWLLGLGF